MNVLIVTATPFEINPLVKHLQKNWVEVDPGHYQKGQKQLNLLNTGVGMMATSWYLSRELLQGDYQLALNLGVAGSFRRDWPLGMVLHVISESFGDLGVEEADGSFTDLFELGLKEPEEPPFVKGKLLNQQAALFDFLPKAHGLTVNKVHGTAESIRKIRQKYPEAEVESMEGAAFFHACLLAKIPFLEIRAISNYVETRMRENWEMEKAIDNLNTVAIELLKSL